MSYLSSTSLRSSLILPHGLTCYKSGYSGLSPLKQYSYQEERRRALPDHKRQLLWPVVLVLWRLYDRKEHAPHRPRHTSRDTACSGLEQMSRYCPTSLSLSVVSRPTTPWGFPSTSTPSRWCKHTHMKKPSISTKASLSHTYGQLGAAKCSCGESVDHHRLPPALRRVLLAMLVIGMRSATPGRYHDVSRHVRPPRTSQVILRTHHLW
jgi:hypothetical protein